jgi:hypothetical protein
MSGRKMPGCAGFGGPEAFPDGALSGYRLDDQLID